MGVKYNMKVKIYLIVVIKGRSRISSWGVGVQQPHPDWKPTPTHPQGFRAGPEFKAMWKLQTSTWNSRTCSGTGEEDQVTWLDLQPGQLHIFFKITNHNQHAFDIRYLANFIKKYLTCFRYQKRTNYPVRFPNSIRVQLGRQPSWKICSRIQVSFVFWGHAFKVYDNFSWNLAWLSRTIFWKFWQRDLSPRFSIINKI